MEGRALARPRKILDRQGSVASEMDEHLQGVSLELGVANGRWPDGSQSEVVGRLPGDAFGPHEGQVPVASSPTLNLPGPRSECLNGGEVKGNVRSRSENLTGPKGFCRPRLFKASCLAHG